MGNLDEPFKSQSTMSMNKLEIKIEKDNENEEVNLSSMSPKAAKAFAALIDSFSKVINSTVREDIKLEIREGSAVISTTNLSDSLSELLYDEFTNMEKGNSENVRAVEGWQAIQKQMKKSDFHYGISFFRSGKAIDLGERIKSGKKFKSAIISPKSSTKLKFINGELVEAGGKISVNIHVVDPKRHEEYIIECSKNSAKKANRYLYSNVYLVAWETATTGQKTKYYYCDVYHNEESYKLFEQFINKVMDPRYDNIQRLKDIHNECKSYVLNNDYANLRRLLRLFNHSAIDVNIQKTILIILYPLKNDENIKELYKEINDKFEEGVNKKRLEKLKIKIPSSDN